mgnify:CR=1 FL=1
MQRTRNYQLNIRVTDEELAEVKRLAAAMNMKVSELIRFAVLEAAKKVKHE